MSGNALLDILASQRAKMQPIGPTVDDDIKRAIERYGRESVQEAIKRLAKRRRGRPPINDWDVLEKYAREDAEDWLAGHDPFLKRKNYQIQVEISGNAPGHSYDATKERIRRRLTDPNYSREDRMYMFATIIGRNRYSYLRYLEALAWVRDNVAPEQEITEFLDFVTVRNLKEKTGKDPDPSLTMLEVEKIWHQIEMEGAQQASNVADRRSLIETLLDEPIQETLARIAERGDTT
jgi:hypothetical protein